MLGTGFGGTMQLWWQDPLVRPLEKASVCRRGISVIILAGDVQVEVDKGLAAGFDEGGEAATAAQVSQLLRFTGQTIGGLTYATLSARDVSSSCLSKSQAPFECFRR
jgi:hypothetical protein